MTSKLAVRYVDFTEYYPDYKRLQKLKPLIEFGNQKSRPNSNLIDVYLSLLNSILSRLQSIQKCVKTDGKTKLRAAGMQLALILDDTIFTNTNGLRKTPTKLTKLENALEHFRLVQYEAEIFFVYLKAIQYIALFAARRLEKYEESIVWLQKGVTLFQNFEDNSKRCDKKSLCLYDESELYSKSNELMPMENSFKQCEIVFLDILELLATMYKQLNDNANYAQIVHDILSREQYFDRITPFDWVMKLLAIVPTLIEADNFTQSSYYLQTVDQILLKFLSETDLIKCQAIENKLAKMWVAYTLHLLQYSKIQMSTINAAGEESTLPKTATNICESYSKNNAIEGNQFNYFESVSINPLRNQSISTVNNSEAKILFTHCLPMIKSLLNNCDIQTTPIEFIKYNYQIFELYELMAQFTLDDDEQFNYNKSRFDGITQMIDQMNAMCPSVIAHLKKELFIDVNEMQIDLLESNFKRIFSIQSSNKNCENRKYNFADTIAALRCLHKEFVQ